MAADGMRVVSRHKKGRREAGLFADISA